MSFVCRKPCRCLEIGWLAGGMPIALKGPTEILRSGKMTKPISKSTLTAPRPPDEAVRLRVLGVSHILDRCPTRQLEDLARLAASTCVTPIALIGIVGADRVLFKARVGVELSETRRELSFCSWTILGKELLVVPDALEDPRFAANPLV